MKKERVKYNEGSVATNRFKVMRKPRNSHTTNKVKDFQLVSRIIKYIQEEEKF